jgi:hypothetical protein
MNIDAQGPIVVQNVSKAFLDTLLRVVTDDHAKAVYPPHERRNRLSDFLQLYGLDGKFAADLLRFYHEHRLALTAFLILTKFDYCIWRNDWRLRQYHRDLRAFLTRWGLDCLPDDLGYAVVHDWCVEQRERVVQYDDQPEPTREMLIPFGLTTIATIYPVAPLPPVRTTVAVTFDVPHPLVESEMSAQRYWDQQRAAFMRRVRQEREAAGYRYPDKQHAYYTHLLWLYRRVAYRESCDAIAGQIAKMRAADNARPVSKKRGGSKEKKEERDAPNRQAIQKATKKVADIMGLHIPRPRS